MRLLQQSPRATAESRAVQRPSAWFWLQAFLILEIVCQVALLFEAIGGLRVVMRCAAYSVSLALLVLLYGQGPAHPARRWAGGILLVVCLQLLHPEGNTFQASTAQLGLYVAIVAPLFWVARLGVTTEVLRRVLFIFWCFHTLSAGIGVLQVYYPGRFQPNISSALLARSGYVESLRITLASGERVLRPMGLTDIPGGAATSGMYALLFGIGFFLYTRNRLLRLLTVVSMAMGLFDIYLSQVRAILLMTAACVLVFALILLRRGDTGRLVSVMVAVPVIVLASFVWAVSVGGESVTNRLGTLIEERPERIYYQNRGIFLEYTVTELVPRFPLGCGLGRWGMTNYYFGDNSDPERPVLGAEIQLTAWLYDGGIPLILLYATAIGVACRVAWQIALYAPQSSLKLWAALILSYNIGAIAVTFNYPLYIGQGGLEFWLLNACLYGAAVHTRRSGPPLAVSAGDQKVAAV